ncbi:MAG: PHP domain-containing protein [Alphaproteobacteria bacterium]|nr:PHP domain-containing protein [Alphaproteobacteria bacterium]
MSAYAELAVTTNFSFLRGASKAEELVLRAKELGLAGIGIADRNSVAGVVRAHAMAKVIGFKIAVGARLVFSDGCPDILAYPEDRAAWGRLTRLLTVGKDRAEKGECILGGPTCSTRSKDSTSLSCRPIASMPTRWSTCCAA